MRTEIAEITGKHCAHTESVRRGDLPLNFEVAVSDSRCGMFSAFVGLGGCRIGPETRNGA
jgi:hypothetical protein